MIEPKISIILPVYNNEKHLERCFDSILAQTFTDFEAVFVDDCSTDGSYELLKGYAASEPRICAIRQAKNSGPGAARNLGIEKARGKYLSFVDSDDMIAPDFLELLYNKAESTGAPIVKGSALIVEGEDLEGAKPSEFNELILQRLEDGLHPVLCFREEHWSALYLRSYIERHSIRYGYSRAGQDSTFLLRACSYLNGVEFEDAAHYYYFQNEGSIVHSFNETRFKGCLDAFEEQMDFINSSALDEETAVQCVYLGMLILLGMHSFMLYNQDPAADAFGERLHGILMRFKNAENIRRLDYAMHEFIDTNGKANIDPTLIVTGLEDCTNVRLAALRRLRDHILARQNRDQEKNYEQR